MKVVLITATERAGSRPPADVVLWWVPGTHRARPDTDQDRDVICAWIEAQPLVRTEAQCNDCQHYTDICPYCGSGDMVPPALPTLVVGGAAWPVPYGAAIVIEGTPYYAGPVDTRIPFPGMVP